jgi:ketosteroid isomerase-like protein
VNSAEQERRNRDVVCRVYEASFAGDTAAFPAAMDNDFEEYVPSELPWGGTHRGPIAFVNDVLPRLAAAVDFGRMRLVSVSADGDHVAALLTTYTLSGEELWIAEHWTLRNGKLWRLRVFYHDTRPLESSAASTAS